MEPTAVPTAPRGTLEDPEILQNVPGHVIPILQREFDDFKTEATRNSWRGEPPRTSSSSSASSRGCTASASRTCR